MRRAGVARAGLCAALALAALLANSVGACELVLAGSRSARELARLPMHASPPAARIAFTHSVLGTPVSDLYVWRLEAGQWRAHLIEERFEGQGYGLPHQAAPFESLTREGEVWRLRLDRLVHPLQVLPLPAQQMRLLIEDHAPILLGSLGGVGGESIQIRAERCVGP